MKHRFLHIFGMALLLTEISLAEPNPQDDPDPFAPVPEQKLAKGEFFTAGGGWLVKPLSEWGSPELVPPEELPKVKAPTNFNRSFDSPTKVWRVRGGYLASFDAGEFGGALFFAQHGAKRWTRILDAHIQHLVCFEGDTFLAAGGLAHVPCVGHAFIISRSNKGKWKANPVFKTTLGIPAVLGTTFTESNYEAKSEKLIVIGLDPTLAWKPLFGISRQGEVHYLGETLKTKENDPPGDGQPDAKPADKAPVEAQPPTQPPKDAPR